MWDRSVGVAQLLEVDGPDGVTELIRGLGLESGVTGGAAVSYGRGPLGDVTSGSVTVSGFGPFGEAGSETQVGVGYRGELVVGGTIYLRNRSLDTATGRFLSTDGLAPVWGTAATSTYQYAFDNPIGFTDPSGLRPGDGGWLDMSFHMPEFHWPDWAPNCVRGMDGCDRSWLSEVSDHCIIGWDSDCWEPVVEKPCVAYHNPDCVNYLSMGVSEVLERVVGASPSGADDGRNNRYCGNIDKTWTCITVSEAAIHAGMASDGLNSVRHCLWSAEMTSFVGETEARGFLERHEVPKDVADALASGVTRDDRRSSDTASDLFNNEVGISIGRAGGDRRSITEACWSAYRNGQLNTRND